MHKNLFLPFIKQALGCSAFIFTFQSSGALAQERDSLKFDELQEVILEHKKINIKHISPVPVQILSGERLQAYNSLSVADAVRYFSGVQLKDYGGIGGLKTINVRSMGSHHTGVFYDGVQLGNAQNGQVDLGKFSLDNIEKLALYNGQRPDITQAAKAYASANAIYLETKTPKFRKDKNYNLKAGFKTGSFGLVNPSLSADYKFNNSLFMRLSAETVQAHGRYDFRYTNGIYDTTATRENADIESYRFEAALYGEKSFQHWNVKYYHFSSERGLPGAVVANRFMHPQRLWDESNFVQGEFQQHITPNYTLTFRSKFGKDYSRYLDPEIVTTTGSLNTIYEQQEAYLSLTNTYRLLAFWKMALAVDYQFNSMDANLYRFAYPERKSVLAALVTDFHFDRFDVQASLLSTSINESVKHYRAAGDKQELTPTLMLSWQPFQEQFRIRGFYKKIFRMPTFNDLYYTFIGNTNLKPEYTKQYNLGFSYYLDLGPHQLELQGDAYKIWVKDKIVAIPGANLFKWTMFNLGRVETTGAEFNLKTRGPLSSEVFYSAGVGYTFQEALDVTPGVSNYGQQIPYTTRHSGNFNSSIKYRDIRLNYSFIYTGERYSQKATIKSNYQQPWYTHDLSGNYRFSLWKNPLQFGVEINNLLNHNYSVIKNFPMPGRSYRVTLNYTI